MKAEEYASELLGSNDAPRYVKKQCREFLDMCGGKSEKYFVNRELAAQNENILKLLIMPKGIKAGQSLYECTTGYQWLFYTAVLCTVYRDNPKRRRYETAILEIARKNFKTYTIATVFILLFLTEPRFSRFFSVAPDGSLSREVREAISETIKSSPLIYSYGDKKRWKILRDYILFIPTETKFTPLAYATSTFDGKLPNVFLADEVGALPNNSAIESMRSGQLNILNKLGCIISTKYPTIDNPFENEVAYAKRVLDGLENDETVFALLFEPDDRKNWMTDDTVLKQANPAAKDVPEIWEDLLKKRKRAISLEAARENFLTKHCNIIYQGAGTETFIDVEEVKKCRTQAIDWSGRVVYVFADLSLSNDNTSVVMVADDDGDILCKPMCFIPEGRIEEKQAAERVNYKKFIEEGKCIACGDRTIDYAVVEDYILNLEATYGVKVQAFGFDRWNALSTAQKIERAGYNTVEVRQHSSVLHSPTKLLYEKILNGRFKYEENELFEINFQNARCSFDTNLNRYVTKKKSNGKVDMVVATIGATALLEQDVYLNHTDFCVQVL